VIGCEARSFNLISYRFSVRMNHVFIFQFD